MRRNKMNGIFNRYGLNYIVIVLAGISCFFDSYGQKLQPVKITKESEDHINIYIGGNLFTTFLYPAILEKPVLYPVYAANGVLVTRGFPLDTQTGEPTDHPHHVGIWFNFENVNGLDFWNNSYAIPKEKKNLYGWIKNVSISEMQSGSKGILSYHADWTGQENNALLQETTRFEFTGTTHQRIIDRRTVLEADTDVLFTDAKDGMLGIRLAHAFQMPTNKDQEFTDDKGNVTFVKGGTDTVANGNYVSSEGKQGDDVWSTRGRWCKVYSRIGSDSVSVVIIDHPSNPNYPTFWHARGYGLFAANPLGEKIFTNGKTAKNLRLKKGAVVGFRYRIVIDNGENTISAAEIDRLADEFARSK